MNQLRLSKILLINEDAAVLHVDVLISYAFERGFPPSSCLKSSIKIHLPAPVVGPWADTLTLQDLYCHTVSSEVAEERHDERRASPDTERMCYESV